MAHTNEIEGKILYDNNQTSYGLWRRALANQEATYAQNGCSRHENVEVDVVKLGRAKLEMSAFESI